MKMTCAKCGEDKELARSARMDGIMQPRFCKECLIKHIQGDETINDKYWFRQLTEKT